MDQGYKHFIHSHNLMMHRLNERAEVSCSGCNSSGTGTVFVCWQCNFFLHEQCYRATRSLKHPSHPSHPLTLVPYPTYPSNSFYCNSCQIMGTGLSYSCADCEFDLHVQCAYSIPRANLAPQGWNGVQNSNMTHSVPFVSVPDSLSIPLTGAQDHYLPPNSVSNTQYHPTSHGPYGPAYASMAQNGPSVSIPMASTPYPSLVQTGPFASIPTNPLNHFPRTQDPSMPQNGPYISIPTESGQSLLKDKGILHFSHPHNLSTVNLQEDDKKEVTCSGCEKRLVGKGYSCAEHNCNFHLHESCFQLKKEIQHKSHPEHPLVLRPSIGPYNNINGQFTCNACFTNGTGFSYHCSICDFDLHIQCVNLPETAKRTDHDHVLQLLYSCPVNWKEYRFTCDVCRGVVEKDRWAYYCTSCDYGTHLGCVNREPERKGDSVLDTQVELQRLQLQMQMAQQQAQLIASMGSSIASLV